MSRPRPVPTEWAEPLDQYGAYLRASHTASTTIGLRRRHLAQIAALHPDPWAVTGDDLVAWIASHNWQRATAASVRSTLRNFYGWAHETGRIGTDPSRRVPKITPRQPTPHPLPDDALAAALAAAGDRERLMLHLAGRCGLRRGEIARCRGVDVHGHDGAWSLVVVGKGARPRVVPMPDDLAHAVRARGSGWTFPSAHGEHLSPDYVGALTSRLMPDGWSLHSLRHRFATRAYAATRDVYAVQALLGHASPATTLHYVLVPDDAMRRAMLAAA